MDSPGQTVTQTLLFVLLFIVLQETFHRFLHAINLRQLMAGRPEALLLFVIDAFHFAAVLLVTVAAALIEKKRVPHYGLPATRKLVPLMAEGIVWGCLAESAALLTLRATGNVSLPGIEQRGHSAIWFALLWGVAFLAVGFFEEPRTANWRQMSVYFRDLDENLIKVAYYA